MYGPRPLFRLIQTDYLVFFPAAFLFGKQSRVIKSRRMRWAGYVARMGEEKGVYRFLVRKPEGKRSTGET